MKLLISKEAIPHESQALISTDHTLVDPRNVTPLGMRDYLILGTRLSVLSRGNPIDVEIVGISELQQKEMLYKHGIPTPKTYTFKNIEDALGFLCTNSGKYVLKKLYQNRGLGKLVVDYDYLNGLLRCDSKEEYLEYVGEDNLGQIRNEEEKFLLYEHYEDTFLEEFVNIKKEYRLILINKYDDKGGYAYDLYERKNMRVGKSEQGSRTEETDCEIDHVLNKEYVTELLNIMEEEKTVFMSFDLYEDEEGDVGVIEYNPTFGTKGYGSYKMKLLQDATTAGLENLLKKKLNVSM